MMSNRNALPTVICLVTVTLLLAGCSPQETAPAATSVTEGPVAKPTPQVIIQGESADMQEIQTIEIDNCDGKSNATRTEQHSQSIDVTISAEVAAKLGASVEVISAEVQAAVGVARTQGAQRSTSIQLSAPPGTRMLFQLIWIGREQIGIVQNLRGSSIPIAFQGFAPTDVRIKSQSDIGCPDSSSPKPIFTAQPPVSTPTVAPKPPQSSTLCPATISQSQVNSWKFGEANAPVPTVQEYVDKFDQLRPGDIGAYRTDQMIPSGVLLATNFDEADANKWRQFPVIPIIHSGSWGLWQTTGEFQAPNAGACITIVP